MIFGGSLAQAEASFLERFEPDGDAFLFRAAPTSAPVRVTAAEREEERASFRRGMSRLLWATALATIVVICVVVTLMPGQEEPNDTAIWSIILTLTGCFTTGWWRLWGAPARRFERRGAAGKSRTRAEIRGTFFREISWWKLAAALLFAALLSLRYFDGEHIWAGIGAALAILVVLQGIRKVRNARLDR